MRPDRRKTQASVGGVVALVSSFFLIGKLSKLLLLRLSVATCAVFLALLMVSRLVLAFAPISPVKYIKYTGIAAGLFLVAALRIYSLYAGCRLRADA